MTEKVKLYVQRYCYRGLYEKRPATTGLRKRLKQVYDQILMDSRKDRTLLNEPEMIFLTEVFAPVADLNLRMQYRKLLADKYCEHLKTLETHEN